MQLGGVAVQVFEANPEQLCTTIDVEDPETQTRFHYAVQVPLWWRHTSLALPAVLTMFCDSDTLIPLPG